MAVDPPALAKLSQLVEAGNEHVGRLVSGLASAQATIRRSLGQDEISRQFQEQIEPQLADVQRNVLTYQDAGGHVAAGIFDASANYETIDRNVRARLQPPNTQRPAER
jgi:hypothetical protein